MKKLINLLGILFLVCGLSANANVIDKIISKSKIQKDNISISLRDLKSGATVYELNSKKLTPPASTQKIITYTASKDMLGDDYEFTTYLYKSTNNDLYFKLGADPYLRTKDLRKMLATAKSKNIISPKNIYIDNSIIDSVDWGEGWQWDDELNPLMPKFGAYNLDGNLLDIVITPRTLNTPAEINTGEFYPITFMNMVKSTKDTSNVNFKKNNSVAPDIIVAEGSVSKNVTYQIPVSNLRRYFNLRLEEVIRKNKVDYYGKLTNKNLPKNNIYLVDKISHPLSQTQKDVLLNSYNLVAETVFKIAGGKYANKQGTVEDAVSMLEAYCNKIGAPMSDIRIVDGSGVSKNNLMSADFMSEFLFAQSKLDNFEEFKNSLASPGEGTLANRMLYFRDNLKAKTGTLSDISAIAGYITTRKGHNYAFDIMINDARSNSADKKMLEEYILRNIYLEF